ncbi:unnamed protein product [Phytophthora fragariaefolia]|uniref:Unnamed protein product n=1 Tax=Phytophthora fragariaefolia TaxID=1490495 RepID=A0A9W7D0K0_9STRA|nr:unnamed protein product [Phytophthora fragariaefolia]
MDGGMDVYVVNSHIALHPTALHERVALPLQSPANGHLGHNPLASDWRKFAANQPSTAQVPSFWYTPHQSPSLHSQCSHLMSGFERILARVGGDALRSYCSSAIEDELRHLQTRMQTCLESAEQALKVQQAVAKLDVPLSRENAATCAEIRRKFAAFSIELRSFVDEQRALQAQAPAAADPPEGGERRRSEQQSRERVAKLLGKIQHRIRRKRSDAWIDKSLAGVEAVARLIVDDDFAGPDKALRNELVLVLDHLISAVLLSPLTTQATLEKMDAVLQKLAGVHADIDQSSGELLAKKRAAYALQGQTGSQWPAAASNDIVNAAEEPRVKRQRVEPDPESEYVVKEERIATAVDVATAAGSDASYEVYVSDLPWGTIKEDVVSYFGIAGAVKSVQMPTMSDGSTVGVAIIRFAALEGMALALRMDGYPFNGKNIRVAVHKPE